MTIEEKAAEVAVRALQETESVVRWEHPALIEDIAAAIREAVAEEREACALIADDLAAKPMNLIYPDSRVYVKGALNLVSIDIRARSDEKPLPDKQGEAK
jgi:hypothetical protein